MPLGRFTAGRMQVDLPDRRVIAERPGALAYRAGRPQMSPVKRLILIVPALAAAAALSAALSPALGPVGAQGP